MLQTTLIQRANSRSRRRAIRRDATPPRRSRSSSATTTRSPGTSRHEICPKIYTAGFLGQKFYTHHWSSAVWVIKTQTNEWKWILLHRWQNFYTATRKSHLWEHHCQKGRGLKNLDLNNQTKTKYLNFAARSCKSPKICHLLHHHDLDHLVSSRVWIEVRKKSFERGKRGVYEKWWWHQPRVIFVRLHWQVESAPLHCLWVFLIWMR